MGQVDWFVHFIPTPCLWGSDLCVTMVAMSKFRLPVNFTIYTNFRRQQKLNKLLSRTLKQLDPSTVDLVHATHSCHAPK